MASIKISSLSNNIGTIIQTDKIAYFQPENIDSNTGEQTKYWIITNVGSFVFDLESDRDSVMTAIENQLSPTII